MTASQSVREASKLLAAAADELEDGQPGAARLLIDLAHGHLIDAAETVRSSGRRKLSDLYRGFEDGPPPTRLPTRLDREC